jgi:hypothetical protein
MLMLLAVSVLSACRLINPNASEPDENQAEQSQDAGSDAQDTSQDGDGASAEGAGDSSETATDGSDAEAEASEDSSEADQAEVESEDEEDQMEAEPNASDSCLFGNWVVDNESLGSYLTKKMNTSDDVTFNMVEVSGAWIWSFDDTSMYMQTENEPLNIVMEIVAGETNLGTSTVTLTAFGDAAYYILVDISGDDPFNNMIVNGRHNYEIEGDGTFTLEQNGQSADANVTVTPHIMVAELPEGSPEFTWIAAGPNYTGEETGYVYYSCEGDILQIDLDDPGIEPLTLIRRQE